MGTGKLENIELIQANISEREKIEHSTHKYHNMYLEITIPLPKHIFKSKEYLVDITNDSWLSFG